MDMFCFTGKIITPEEYDKKRTETGLIYDRIIIM